MDLKECSAITERMPLRLRTYMQYNSFWLQKWSSVCEKLWYFPTQVSIEMLILENRKNRDAEAMPTSAINLCFRTEIIIVTLPL